MPELPEVETVRRYLEGKIIGHTVKSVHLSNVKSLRNVSKNRLSKLSGQKIIGTDRLAKHLIIKFTNDYLILHLRMEGKLFVFSNKDEMNSNTNRFHDVMHVETDKGIILFQDTRRFATIDLFENSISLIDNPVLNKVGKEPFDLEGKDLFSLVKNKRSPIKSVLLDQSIISGLGNIYVDEVLFLSKILPETKANELSENDCKLIIDASRKILAKAIELGGSTIKSYTSSLGVEGSYQNHLNVHQQLKCRKCGNVVTKIKVGGRGTYFCSVCQNK